MHVGRHEGALGVRFLVVARLVEDIDGLVIAAHRLETFFVRNQRHALFLAESVGRSSQSLDRFHNRVEGDHTVFVFVVGGNED